MLYAVTLLTDEELKQSIAENVIHPDMKRDDLQKWRNSRQRLASSPKESESDTAVASPAIASTQDAVESGALPSTMGDDNRDQQQLAVAPEDAAPEAAATAPAGQLTPPSEEIPAFLDRRPLSPEDQCAFDVIMAAYNIASPVVRERVRAEIIRADGSSRADAGVKNRDVEVPGYMPARATPEVVVPRKRRRRRKFLGPRDELPF